MKHPLKQRALAWLLSLVCVLGLLPPADVFAADSIPNEITLIDADYPTGTSSNGTQTYKAPNGLEVVTIHNFRVTAGGKEVTGFCGDHSKHMGKSWETEKWANPGPVDTKVYPLLAYYYSMCEDPNSGFNGGASGWANQVTNSYIQCCIWLAKANRLPDYHTDSDGWIAAVAEQREAAYDHYHAPNPSEWTHEMDAAARLDEYESGVYGTDWSFLEYKYTGGHGDPQPIIIGLRSEHDAEIYKIKKVDTMGNNVSGVTFRVESENGSFMTTVTTDSNGEARFNSTAGDGWYTLTETAAPSGYVRNPTPVRVYLAVGVTGEIQLANTGTIKKSLEIRKVDIDDPTKGIAGAVIKLTHPASGRTSTFTSGADGWVVIPQAFVDEMLTGLWEAEEITPPAGYRLNPDVNVTKQTFVWDGGRTPISLIFTNDRDVQIRFHKVDADDPTKGLPGAVVAVYKDGVPITIDTTDEQGYITINGVSEGFWVFEELTPPPGYARDIAPYAGVHIDPAQIAGNETIEVKMVNHKTPKLRIRKVDAETGDGIPNTRFSVVGVNNNYSNTVTTDADGWAVLTDVDAAVYEITELSVPAPYILDTNNRRTVALRAGEDHSISFANGKEPGLRIIKKDLITGDVVPGVTFRIEKIDGSYSTELTTDANGEVFFEHIAAGTYRVQEIAVPGDYILSDEIKTVNLESNKTTTLEFFNSKKPGLRIIKKDLISGDVVPGVTFRIEKIDGTYSTELTTDAHGEVFVPNLAAGAYRVQEVSVPGNYILDTTVKTVTLEADSTAILEFRNYQRPGLLIKKTTSDGQNLEGVRFNVKVKDGSSIGDFTTDARGEIFIPDLTAQWYTITETYVPEGYILDSTPHDVLLEAGASGDGKVYQTYSVVNHAKPKLTIYKVDSVVGGSVEGAKFQITFAGENQNGSVRDLGVHVSDRNGEIKLENLDVGWYRIKEISAPDGYQLNNEEKLVYLQADDVKSVTFENTPLNAIIVLKRDSVSGEPVEGCTFQLRYLSGTSGTGGTVIGTQTTSTTGTAIWTGLQAGTYIIEEVRAADGYVITETAQTVYLSGNAQDTVTVYFDNNPKGSLLIKKVCSNNPSVMLAGAQFEVKYTDGSFIGNSNGIYTTNANGEILITDLVPNKSVVVTEIKAPDGFVKDTAPQSIEVKAGQVVTLTFANAPKGRLIIEKRDSTNNQLLAGAEFRVTTAAGCEVGQNGVIGDATATSAGLFRTGADGKITLTNLIPGTYIITEVTAPDGYLIDDPTRTVTITKGDTQTVVFKDTPKGTLTVQKLDSRTHKPLAGAQFRITDSSGAALDNHGGTVSSNGYYETNAEGRIDIYDVLPDTYVVNEIKAPAGYAIDNASQTVKLNANDHQTLTFYDTALTTLVIHKYIDGTANEPLQGVRFKVVDGEGAAVGPDDGVYYTDANGEIVLTGLEPGTTVKAWETKTVAGFVLDGTPQDIQIKAGEAQTLTFWNKRLGSLVVEKQDSITGAPLPGAEFRITYADGRFLDNDGGQLSSNGRYVTDANGQIHVTGFIGTVVVEEVSAPDGYTIDEGTKRQTVTVNPNDTQTLTFKNTPTQTLTIQKYIDGTNKPLAGVTYSVTYADGKPVGSGQYVTDASGRITIPGLPVGTAVTIREIRTVKGYALNPYPQTVVITAATSGSAVNSNSVTFYNVELNTLTIHKYEEGAANKPLKGVEFKITDGSGKAVGSSNGIFYTDAQGSITIPNLEAGMTLTVRETKALEGYVLDGTPKTITISGDGENNELTFWNAPQGVLIVKKLDSVTKEPLAGAEFKIIYDNGAFVDNANGHISSNGIYTTDANGEIRIAGLTGTVVVEETKAPDGYVLDPNSARQTVKVNASDAQTLTFYNTAIGGLTIYKVDADSGKRLSGAKIEVRRMNGAIVGTYTSDRNGVIRLPQLDNGWYELTELKAPEGYILDTTPQKVEVKQGRTTVFEFENTASASMLIHKIDANSGKGLQGAKFVLYDNAMIPLGEYESDNNGYVHLSKTLKDGRYYVREIVAPEGYILDNNTKSIYVISGETATIEWKNTPQLAQIQIVKTSADYNPTNGLPAGTPLPDAVYTVYDKRMNVVDTIRTNASGVANTKMLPLGFYHVKETTAPANYGIDTATYDVELEFVGQVYRLNLTNKSVSARVAIRKSGPQIVMNGQNLMMYRISGVRNDSTVALQSFYWRDTLPVDAFRLSRITTGTYSSTQSYKVTYTTNYDSTWRTAYDNLTTAKNYTLDMSASALGLRGGEYVTEVMLSFGVVPAGFHQLTEAAVYGSVLRELVNGYQFTNKVDVGGLLGGHWEQGIARWTTTVKSTWTPPALPKLPRTGY